MSFYYEAAEVFDIASKSGGSIKSIVFSKKSWKSDSRALFALTTETAKWSDVLAEVIEKSGILTIEKQLTPTQALLLTHDLLLAAKGLALPHKHGLSVAVGKHKARLGAELTKERLRRGFASLNALRLHLNGQPVANGSPSTPYPRWIRINTIRTTLEDQLETTFAAYQRSNTLIDVRNATTNHPLIYLDKHVSDLVAIPSHIDITSNAAYRQGKLILQDKASCFPACLLDPASIHGDIIDACAAPGNKTTHLAALRKSSHALDATSSRKRRILACERDRERSKTLSKMVNLAGAYNIVQVKANQDFLRLDPRSSEFSEVAAILLDPSCSGSGIVGRDEVVLNLRLPVVDKTNGPGAQSRKRKRGAVETNSTELNVQIEDTVENVAIEPEPDDRKLQTRLSALSAFQLRLLEHAMAFPAATRITYSTCSLHCEENERVVVQALTSGVAVERGWRTLRREQQVEGMRRWHTRGDVDYVSKMLQDQATVSDGLDPLIIADACIRCEKGGEDGTMGFFVAGFIRDTNESNGHHGDAGNITDPGQDGPGDDEDEWQGFSDKD